MGGWQHRAILLGVGLLGFPLAVVAQDPDRLVELKRLSFELQETRGAVTAEAAEAARRKLDAWGLKPADLDGEPRLWLAHAEILTALGEGHAQRAADWLLLLEQEAKDATETLRVQWNVAGALGDGAGLLALLKTLKDKSLVRGAAYTRRELWLSKLGTAAPDQTVQAESGESIALRDRQGVVAVLHFWQVTQPPPATHLAGLREVHQELVPSGRVLLVGINYDAPENVQRARAFAREQELTWPQVYEQSPAPAPLAQQAFNVTDSPWHVLIDATGNVRAVGSARDAAFQYALRAAVAEAAGRFRAVLPRTVNGRSAEPYVAPAKSASAGANDKFVPPSARPSDPEAKRLLDQARLYLKTGKKRDAKALLEEVVAKYPGTREAADAEEWLASL